MSDMNSISVDIATKYCVACGVEFTTDNPCCRDSGTLDDGTHIDGCCLACIEVEK